MFLRCGAVLVLLSALGTGAVHAATNDDIWKLQMRRAMEAHRAGDLDAAAQRLQQALTVAEMFEDPSEHLAETLLAVSAVRFDGQDYAGALAPLQRAVTLLERTASPDSTMLAGAHNALGLIHGRQGQPERAGPHYRRALAIYEQALGPDHPRVGSVEENLAGVALMAGRYEDAENGFARALAIKEQAYGRESPELIDTLRSYALVLSNLGREAEADELDARANAINDRIGGSNSP